MRRSKSREVFKVLRAALIEPLPTRLLALRALDWAFDFLSYSAKLALRSVPRAQYGFGLLNAALQARRLGLPAISAVEFGVAGGNGLVTLEFHAARVTKETGVEIFIFGFDNGAGLPPPTDYRDMPYAWEAGFYSMDTAKLRARLRRAELIIGDVAETAPAFGAKNPPPIGFIAFDLDYYSSTKAAFRIFDIGDELILPRIFCYFDDVAGSAEQSYNEFTGELLAINEFNAANADRKIARISGLQHDFGALPALWHEKMYVAHAFRHPLYCVPVHAGQQSHALS